MIRAASVLSWVLGAGFGLPCIYGIWNMYKGRGIAYVLGFPSYGNGPFEKFGVHSSIPLLVAFLLVCALECAAGWMLWSSSRAGAVVALAILPVEIVFWIGFALPYGPVLGIARTLLILIAWQMLRS